MSNSSELRRQIEDLALRLVVGDSEAGASASAWIPAVEGIRVCALREQSGEVAVAAVAILEKLQAHGDGMDDPCDVAAVLQEGIDCLQRSVELEKPASALADWRPAQDSELLSDFILESREHLAGIEAQLLTIEREPLDAEALNSVFRGFHTIKGLAGFLELWEVQKLAHEVETILDRARNSQFLITPPAIDVILLGRRLPAAVGVASGTGSPTAAVGGAAEG